MGRRERLAATPEGAAALLRAELARALLGALGHRAAHEVAQGCEAVQQRAGQGPHLAVAARARARDERRVREAVRGEDPRLAALRAHLLEAARAEVVGAALDRESAQLRVAEHRGRGRDVLAEELVL